MVEIRFKPSAIGTPADGSVTSAKIADGAVVEAKLGAEAVSESKIKTDAITRGKIKDGEVVEAKVVTKTFVKCLETAGKYKTLKHGYDESTGEIVLIVDDTVNPA